MAMGTILDHSFISLSSKLQPMCGIDGICQAGLILDDGVCTIMMRIHNHTYMEGEEQVADENERSETEATTGVKTVDPFPQDEEEEETLSPTKLKDVSPSAKQIIIERPTLDETICIEDGNVLLVMLVGKKLEAQGKLKVTNQRLQFIMSGKQQEEPLLQLPIGYLARCDRTLDDRVTTLQVFVKYGCSFKLRCGEGRFQFALKAHQLINEIIKNSWKLALEWGALAPKENLCAAFPKWPPGKDCYEYENEGWKRLPNYPQRFMVPLNYLSRNNPEDRLVIFSFSYKSTREEVSVWRTGPGRPDYSQQQWLAKAKLPSSRSFTIQIKNKGIGSGKSLACRMIQLEGLPLLKQSFGSLFRIAFHNHQSLKWLANFNQTRWLDQIALLLQQASALVARVTGEQSQVVTILADTDIRGAQLVALAQVLLFPENRTLNGFGGLLQRELLQWGHARGKKEEPDRGAAIIQFLDAVFQLTCIYPLSFEFNQNYLVFLAQNVYSNRFGNFLLASRAIKQQQRSHTHRCQSIWQYQTSITGVTSSGQLYLNPFYVDFKECDIYELKQFPSSKSLRIWNGFFFKRLKEKNPDYHIFHRYQQIHYQHLRNKRKTEQLRKELSEQHKILVQRREILKELKALQ